MRDQWNPVEDTRIPLRDHEPMGRYSVRFDRIDTRWLRRGLQWHCKVGLDTGVLSWSTVHRRIVAVEEFDVFLPVARCDGPLAGRSTPPGCARSCWTSSVTSAPGRSPVDAAPGSGCPGLGVSAWPAMSSSSTCSWTDNKDAAAAALAEPGWLRLGPQHAGFYRRGEMPGKQQARLEGHVIDDDAMTQIMGGLDLLGAAVERRRVR